MWAAYYLLRANRNFRIKAFDFYIIVSFDFADTLLTVKGQVAQKSATNERERESGSACTRSVYCLNSLSLIRSLCVHARFGLCALFFCVFPNEVRK